MGKGVEKMKLDEAVAFFAKQVNGKIENHHIDANMQGMAHLPQET
jgi:hypothetical protein